MPGQLSAQAPGGASNATIEPTPVWGREESVGRVSSASRQGLTLADARGSGRRTTPLRDALPRNRAAPGPDAGSRTRSGPGSLTGRLLCRLGWPITVQSALQSRCHHRLSQFSVSLAVEAVHPDPAFTVDPYGRRGVLFPVSRGTEECPLGRIPTLFNPPQTGKDMMHDQMLGFSNAFLNS